tara:strand:+ start:780 stop:1751 length:972 start_codon:yes stop_codon:yes gene_type:complete
VIIDIMDAWPETFYRALPSPLRKTLGPILLAPMHRSAQRAYQGADKISAVGQNYLNLAQQYLQSSRVVSCPWGALAPDSDKATGTKSQSLKQSNSLSRRIEEKPDHSAAKPSLPPLPLCYHGTDLERFPRSKSEDGSVAKPLQLVYIGALETSYDLNTIIEAVESLNQSGTRTECHIAGAGSQEATLKARIQQANQAAKAPIIIFHGHLQKAALDALLENSHFGMIPMQADSFVGLPYKMADYTRTGLPILSSLGGESRELIEHKKAGAFYRSGSRDHLVEVIQSIVQQPALYNSMASNSRQIAEQLFDRTITYKQLAKFIIA